jgi:hypothetical protein
MRLLKPILAGTGAETEFDRRQGTARWHCKAGDRSIRRLLIIGAADPRLDPERHQITLHPGNR